MDEAHLPAKVQMPGLFLPEAGESHGPNGSPFS